MIPRTVPAWQSQTWQEQLMSVIKHPRDLASWLGLDYQQLLQAYPDIERNPFPLRVTQSFAARMKRGDLQDPLLLQVLPRFAETVEALGYTNNPVGEFNNCHQGKGIIQKYQGRVLLLVTSACAIHCRYCFRREFPYAEHRQKQSEWQLALQTIKDDPSISEVILSGGDPLAASDQLLANLVAQIEAIPHVQTLRIHTRLPVVLPDRVDDSLLHWLSSSSLKTVMVIHSNHPQELDNEVAAALAKLTAVGVVLLNQTVLLRDVNDCVQILQNLSQRLFKVGVLPYYLHLLDKVRGAHHFDVLVEEALAIHTQLKTGLPGYLVPKLVQEQVGEPFKTVLG